MRRRRPAATARAHCGVARAVHCYVAFVLPADDDCVADDGAGNVVDYRAVVVLRFDALDQSPPPPPLGVFVAFRATNVASFALNLSDRSLLVAFDERIALRRGLSCRALIVGAPRRRCVVVAGDV